MVMATNHEHLDRVDNGIDQGHKSEDFPWSVFQLNHHKHISTWLLRSSDLLNTDRYFVPVFSHSSPAVSWAVKVPLCGAHSCQLICLGCRCSDAPLAHCQYPGELIQISMLLLTYISTFFLFYTALCCFIIQQPSKCESTLGLIQFIFSIHTFVLLEVPRRPFSHVKPRRI